ncbi:MAG TPA: RNA-binding protein, partial [Thermoflexales bacterium]|nr:RNA-binding protein [Thermoflexales bacterium]
IGLFFEIVCLPPNLPKVWRLFLSWRNVGGKGDRMVVKLYVGNLSYETTEEALRTLFAQAGTVVSVAVIKDRDTGSSKGFGFVEMSSQQEAQAAITKFNNFQMGQRALTVNIAKPREDRAGGGGGGGGFSRSKRY